MSGASQLFNVIDRFTAQRGPYARRPADVMIVTAVGTGWVNCRHAWETSSNGFPYVYNASAYPNPVIGDRVLLDNLPSGPVVSGKLSS